jgi:hypothetical protein
MQGIQEHQNSGGVAQISLTRRWSVIFDEIICQQIAEMPTGRTLWLVVLLLWCFGAIDAGET